MPDALRPAYMFDGQWMLAKALDTFSSQGPTATFSVQNVLAPNAVTTNFAGSACTGLLVVGDFMGATGTQTVVVSGHITADQGASGAQAWPVQLTNAITASVGTIAAVSVSAIPAISVSAIPAISVSAIPSVAVSAITLPSISIAAGQSLSAAITGTQTVSVTGAINVGTIAAVSVSANVSQLVSVSAIPSISVSAIPSISVSAIPAVSVSAGTMSVNVNTIGTLPAISVSAFSPTIAVMPGQTKSASTASFSITQSGTVSLIASIAAGSRNILLGWGMFNGDTITHALYFLNGATNSTMIPFYLGPNGAGNQLGLPTPFPMAESKALSISLVGAVGTNAVVGWVAYQTQAT